MNELTAKIAALEAQHARLKLALVLMAGLVAAAAFVTGVGAQQAANPLRVRGLVIEDEAGRPRIVLGAPLGDGTSRRTGLRINDPSGVERLGMTLLANGNLVLGLDGLRAKETIGTGSASPSWPMPKVERISPSKIEERAWPRGSTSTIKIACGWSLATTWSNRRSDVALG